MLYCTVLYCTVLDCTVMYGTVLHCTVLYGTVLHCTVLYCTVLYCTALYYTVLYYTVLYCTWWDMRSLVWGNVRLRPLHLAYSLHKEMYCNVLHSTLPYCNVLHMYCTIKKNTIQKQNDIPQIYNKKVPASSIRNCQDFNRPSFIKVEQKNPFDENGLDEHWANFGIYCQQNFL